MVGLWFALNFLYVPSYSFKNVIQEGCRDWEIQIGSHVMAMGMRGSVWGI